jgi:hypothetical protein
MSNVNISDKNTGDQHTAIEFNLIKNFINSPIVDLGVIDPTNLVYEQNGSYSNYTQIGAVTFSVPGNIIDGIGQIVYFISDGINPINFNTAKFHVSAGLYGITNGETLAAGLWKFWLYSDNGKINVNVPADVPGDVTLPIFSSAEIGTIADDKIVITMSETMDGASVPDISAFEHSGITGDPAITVVSIAGADITLTLASDADSADTPLIKYVKPGTNPLKDSSGNEADSFGDLISIEVITNNISGEDVDAAAWLDALTYTPPAAERAAYNQLFVDLKAIGAWVLIDEIFVRYTYADAEPASKGLKQVKVSTFTNGAAWAAKGGYSNDTTGHVDTNWNPSVDAVSFGGVGAGNLSMIYIAVPPTTLIQDIFGEDQTATGANLYINQDVAGNQISGIPSSVGGTISATSKQMAVNKWYSIGLNDDAGTPRSYLYEDAVQIAGPGVVSSVVLENGTVFSGASRRNTAGYKRSDATWYFEIYGGWGLQALIAQIKTALDTYKTAIDAI